MRFTLLIAFFILWTTILPGQQKSSKSRDALKKIEAQIEIAKKEGDTVKQASFLLKKADAERKLINDTSIQLPHARTAVLLAKATKDTNFYTYALYKYRLIEYRSDAQLQRINETDKRLIYLVDNRNVHDSVRYQVYNHIGKIELKQNYFIKATDAYNKARESAIALGDTQKTVLVLIRSLRLADILLDNIEYDNVQKQIENYLTEKDTYLRAYYYLNLRKFSHRYSFEERTEFLMRANELVEDENNKPFLLNKEMVIYLLDKDRFDSAFVLINYLKELYYNSRSGHLHANIHINELYARYYFETGDYRKAERYYVKAVELCDSLYSPLLKRELLLLVLEIDNEQVNYQIAFEALRALKILEDSTMNRSQLMAYQKIKQLYNEQQSQKKISQLEHEKTTSSLKLANKNKNILWLTTGVLTLFVILLVIFFFYTRKRNTTDQLLKINKVKDLMFSVISHDLRSPLYNFNTLLKMARNNYLTKDEYETYLKTIQEELGSITSTTESLLRWAQSNQGMITVNKSEVNLHEVIFEINRLFNKDIIDKNIHVISNFTQEFTIYTDKDLFTFILRNLVQNAIKFSFDDSQIQINAKEVGEKVQVEVRDFGKGMSPEQLQNLNQTISKAGTDTRGIKSTGIGLIIAKDFAKKLKIEYEVQSKVGEGTTFSLMLNKA